MASEEILPQPERTITHYRIVSKIGAGGMGEVYLAEDTRLDRKVALKLLPAEFTPDADRMRRFIQEAKAVSALNHPNIITVYDIGESEAGRFIVMELVTGQTLRTVIAANNSVTRILALGNQMAQALEAAHAAGITHRDIKPDNIMVRDDGYLKVLDFGLARLLPVSVEGTEAATIVQQTMPGQLLGTVAYMSPEQASGQSVSHQSDIFSLGIVLYELVTGQHPFKAETLVGYLHAITLQAPNSLLELNPHVPTGLENLILRMLEKEANQRPTALEVTQQLEEIANNLHRNSASQSLGIARLLSSNQKNATLLFPHHTVGREYERNELRAAFHTVKAGRGSLLCIAGEPGIGKTTLVEDFLAELAVDNQYIIARGRCSERLAGTEAYLPLLESLENLLSQNGQNVQSPAFRRNLGDAKIPPEGGTLNNLRQTMKQLAPTWYAQVMPLSGESEESAQLLAEVKAASQERMKRELANFLQAVAQPRPLVLFFDDLHWADVSTIDLLNFLAGKFEVLRVLIVTTYRPSDMLLAKHPFLQIKPDLQARGLCKELLLEFLNEAEIAEYLTLEFPDHNFPSEFPTLIHAKTEGSPLFMADLVRYLRDRNVIASTSGVWTLAQTLPDIERELPESVRGMIERKITQLSEDDRKLLTAASVQGYEFDSAVVAQVLSLEADEVEERLEKLERVFAFVKLTSEAEFPNGTLTLKYRFVHVLYQNALYASLRATRKATLSRDVALALEACYGTRSASVANELALLWEAARDYARAGDSFLQAARNAAQTNTQREALQLAQRGIGVLQKLPDTPQRAASELKLQLICGISLIAIESWSAAATGEVFQRACQLCEQIGDRDQLFVATPGMLAYHAIRGDYITAFAHCNRLVQLAEQSRNPHHLAYAYYCHLVVALHIGALTVARSWLEKALAIELGEYALDVSILGDAVCVTLHHFGACTICNLGYFDQAWAMINEGLSLAKKSKHPFTLGRANCATGTIHCYRKEYDLAITLYDEVFSLAKEYDVGTWLDYAHVQRSVAVAFLTPTAQALDQVRQCNQMLRAANVSLGLPMSLIWQAEICGLVGQYTEGAKVIDEVFALIEQTGERNWLSEAWRVKGELLLKANGVSAQAEAENCYQTANTVAQQQSAKQFELRATTSLARLWLQQGKTAEARQMLTEIYGWFTEGFDTADLKDAKALLEECRTGSVSDLPLAEAIDEKSPGHSRSPFRTDPSSSIAVLPFVNISNDPDNEYFCDGLAEELLNAFSKIEALHVAARTSSFSFKGKETDIREIGQKLNVGAVLEGSVRKSGNRLRITAQLINIADGYHLWSEKYDREMQDIFDIQDEISLAIVNALKVKLLSGEKAAMTKRYTDNTEAYELYLMGRFHFSKVTEEGFRKAIEYFEQAIAKEPNYALALGGLADAWLNLWWNGYLAPEEGILKTKAASAKALAVDAALAESHVCLAQIKFYYEWDFSGASQEFKQAIGLNPNYVEAHGEYGLILSLMGRAMEAEAEARRSLELDPLSLITNFRAGWIYYALGQSGRVREYCQRMIEIEPNFFGGYSLSAIEAWRQKQYGQALAEMQTAVALGEVRAISFLGCLYGVTGALGKARQMMDQLQDLSAEQYVPSYYFALVYAGLGEVNSAFECLEQSYEQREAILVYIKFSAALIPGFSTEPRLTDLLRRMGLPE